MSQRINFWHQIFSKNSNFWRKWPKTTFLTQNLSDGLTKTVFGTKF